MADLFRDIDVEIGGMNPCDFGGGIDEINNLDAPRVGYSEVDRTLDHGVVLGETYLRNRVITVRGDMYGRENIREWRRRLANASLNRRDFRFRHYAIGDETYMMPRCVVSNYSVPVTYAHNRDYAKWTVQIVTSTPFFLGDVLHSVSTEDGANLVNGSSVWPLGRVGSTDVWNLSVINYGTMLTGAKFSLSDGVTVPTDEYIYTVYNLTTGEQFSLTGQVYNTYVVDTDDRLIYRNTGGNVSAVFGGDYMQIAPGENHIQLINTGTSGDNVKMTVEWRSAWL